MLRNRIGLGDQQSDDRTVGLRVLTAYYNEASQYPSTFPYTTFNDFLAWAELGSALATDIGTLIRQTSSNFTNSESQATASVVALADQSQGQASQGNIMQAAGGQSNINWSSAAPVLALDIASATGTQALSVAQNVGTGALGTLNLLKYLPWIVLGYGALYVFSFGKSSGGSLGKAAGKFIDTASERIRKKNNPRKRNPKFTKDEAYKELAKIEKSGIAFFSRVGDYWVVHVRGRHGNDPDQWHNANDIGKYFGSLTRDIQPDAMSGHVVVKIKIPKE
jgi:hypothetical protein